MADILIVDDDKELCILLKQCLENDGYKVHILHNGNEVLENLKNVNLVILDVMLPGENGFDVLEKDKEQIWHSCFNAVCQKQ